MFGSHLPKVGDSSPDSNFGMVPTLSVLSTLPADHVWQGPPLPPRPQEGHSELPLDEVLNGLAAVPVYFRLVRGTIVANLAN